MRSSKSPCIRACLCMLLMPGAELIWLTLRLALPNLLIWLEMARFGVSLAALPLSQLRLFAVLSYCRMEHMRFCSR